ncbi:hypothetical protein [Gloeothece verrucosa]|uniref:Uncharacterized protein n=1 Tax=Gloeothece verrucosa (strain PCC 7822) TaxID=497965 RepID=E0UAF6_GLOV7|nr:hypothetical protein [Gloeothece verrucosa]ADN12697.1 hypothetical protein Cyan7822_0661 [Gloeothece verrucosa PCC 7822]
MKIPIEEFARRNNICVRKVKALADLGKITLIQHRGKYYVEVD